MLRKYHIELIRETLGSFFPSASLQDIWRANVAQDSIRSFFGYEPRRHACNCHIAESLAYIDEERSLIGALCYVDGGESKQRAAFGRLLHTVHDIYAHTTYVALWISERSSSSTVDRTAMDGLDPAILENPSLQIARWDNWREPFYYIPLVGHLLRRLRVPTGSHEAINLDSPQRGANFEVAMAIARQRTLHEYIRTVALIRDLGGESAVARFHGLAVGETEVCFPLQRDEWPGMAALAGTGSAVAIDPFE